MKYYRCQRCGLSFDSTEITAEDVYGNDLCPACCKALTIEDINIDDELEDW